MGIVITDGDIEFLDNAASRADDVRPIEVTAAASTSPVRWLVLIAVLVGGGWFITSTGPDPAEDEPTEDQPAVTTPVEEPPSVADEVAVPLPYGPAMVAPVFGAWPSPRERDPNVVRTPGPTQPPEDFSGYAFRSTSIVYVNTAGRPTVVSLESGNVSEVAVAATRTHETFAVLAGEVVPLGEPDAEQAIVFHTYRDVDRPGVGTMGDEQGVGLGPELCLSGETCARPDLGLERVRKGGVVAERFDPDRHSLLSDILEEWEIIDGSLSSPSGYRIPEPVGLIWVIAPTNGGSVSSSGLL